MNKTLNPEQFLDWEALAKATNRQARQDVPYGASQAFVEEKFEEIQQILIEIRHALYFEGIRATDDYIDTLKKSQFAKDETRLYPRIRFNKSRDTVTFYWERLHRHVRKAAVNRKPQTRLGKGHSYRTKIRNKVTHAHQEVEVFLTSEHIKINKTTKRIADATFANEAEWVRIDGPIVEERLCALRKKAEAISKLSRKVSLTKSLLTEKK